MGRIRNASFAWTTKTGSIAPLCVECHGAWIKNAKLDAELRPKAIESLSDDESTIEAARDAMRLLWPDAKESVDLINHPPHYSAHPSGVECITITEHMSFNVGNAVKYLWRADEKGSPLDDLRKARWYIERELAKREKEAT
jgi:hypothetical protein